MSEFNPLEHQLRSWVPRPPSPELSARLFGPSAAPATHAGRTRKKPALLSFAPWPWLAPAMALFVLMASLKEPAAPNLTSWIASPSEVNLSLALHHSDMAPYWDSGRHSGRNAWRFATFDWTNRSRTLSTDAAVAEVWTTNHLFR